MPNAFLWSSNDNNASLTGKIVAIGSLLVAANVVVWTCALIVFYDHPVLFGTSLLAYGFGLRHAVDADHIAAIDNVTRKLMQEGKRCCSPSPARPRSGTTGTQTSLPSVADAGP